MDLINKFFKETEATLTQKMQGFADQADWNKAAECCMKLITQYQPNNLSLILKSADFYLKAGLKKKALVQYQEAGERYAAQANVAKAVSVYRTMINIDPRQPEIRVKLSELYLETGEVEEAWKQGMEAIKYLESRRLAQQAIAILEILGNLPFEDSDKVIKLAEMFRAREQSKKAIEQYLNVSELFLQDMQIQKAAQAYKEVLKINPGNVEAKKGLEVIQDLIDLDEEETKKEAAKIYPQQELWENFSEERLDDILQTLTTPKQENSSENLKEHYELGLIYQEMDLLDAAVEEFKLAAQESSMKLDCYQKLNDCYRKKGMPRLANKYQEKVAQLTPS